MRVDGRDRFCRANRHGRPRTCRADAAEPVRTATDRPVAVLTGGAAGWAPPMAARLARDGVDLLPIDRPVDELAGAGRPVARTGLVGGDWTDFRVHEDPIG